MKRDETKRAAEESIDGYMALEYPPSLAPREVQFARALLAYMEREERITLPALKHISELTTDYAGGPWTKDIHNQADAAIKAIEEGRG